MNLNLSEFYRAESPTYTRGEVVTRPPVAPDLTGLPPRPSGEQMAEVAVNISNLEAEIAAARQEAVQAGQHLAALAERDLAREDDLEVQAEAAELAALEWERELMQSAFPADRAQRLKELQGRLEDHERQATVLKARIDWAEGRVQDLLGRLEFERQRKQRLEAAEAAHRQAETVAAAQRAYWGTASERDLRLLSEAGVDVRQTPRRREPSR
jgi:hypothetical protein